MYTIKTEQVVARLRKTPIVRSQDLEALGISREYLRKLREKGVVERIGRGLYTLPDVRPTEKWTLVEACQRVPRGIVCLLTALRFHNLTTQAPAEVWLALDRKAGHPRNTGLPLRIVRFSGSSLNSGIEEHNIEGAPVRVYSLAKTVADCFKYRNKIGLDVALEALREGWKERRFTMDDLWRYGKACRVANVMRPYLEVLAS